MIRRSVPQGRSLPLGSPPTDYIDSNIALDRMNKQTQFMTEQGGRELRLKSAQDERAREKTRDEILSTVVGGALGGITSASMTPGFNPDAPSPGRPDANMAAELPSQRDIQMDLARRFADQGLGTEANSALGGVYALDKTASDVRDQRYEQILGQIAKGDTATARNLSERYDIDIPESLYADGTLARGMIMANKLYGNADKDRATKFLRAFQDNGGDWEAAMSMAGAPRYTPPKPSTPQGSVELGSDGRPYWVPKGGGQIMPYEGPEGVTFPGMAPGRSGSTDPALSRSRMSEIAAREAEMDVRSTLGPRPTLLEGVPPDEEQAAAIMQWDRAYQSAYEQRMQAGSQPQPSMAPSGSSAPQVPSFAPQGPQGPMSSIVPDMNMYPEPPDGAKNALVNNPRRAAEFDEKYGSGAAARVLRERKLLEDED